MVEWEKIFSGEKELNEWDLVDDLHEELVLNVAK